MLAISLWQPWASLVRDGRKTYETRSWKPKIERGTLLAIHAARYWTNQLAEFQHEFEVQDCPRGAILCVVRYKAAYRTEEAYSHAPVAATEERFGDWTSGRWAWRLELVHKFSVPIPCKGHQSLWWTDPETSEEMARQLPANA